MPKETPIERFRISIDDVDPALVGPMVAAATKLGCEKVRFELIEDVRSFAKKVNHEVKAEDFIKEWLPEHPTFQAIEAVRHFEANGRSKGSAYPALAILVEKKILKKLGPGNYARVDVKHIAGPKADKRKVFAKPGTDAILSYAKRNHGRFSTAKIVELFDKEGRARGSVYASTDKLLKQKQIKRVGDLGRGQYILTRMPSPAPKANGADPVAEVTNG